jgi:adenosylcobinamide-GDP ribazoletransferase
MHKELSVFFTGLMFYTRLPVPKSTGFSEENLNKATRYFPLIGIIVGGVGAGLFWGGCHVLSTEIAIILSLAGMILLTGAFHEDALSDFCDGFGGGYGKEKILAIMKDSRIGTYGAVGLILLLLSKFFFIKAFDPLMIPVLLIAAHALSRLNTVLMIFTSRYVSDQDSAKSKPIGKKASGATLIIAFVFGLLPLLLLPLPYVPVFLAMQGIILLLFRWYVHRQIGGYTGDVLGTLQQLSELGFYLAFMLSINLL